MWSTGWCNWYIKRRCRKFNIRTGGHSQYGQQVTVFDFPGRPYTGTCLDIGADEGRKRIGYLSIDTESCELSILKSFDFDNISVRIIGTENSTRSPAIFRYLTSKGYRLVKTVGCDEIYRHHSVRL